MIHKMSFIKCWEYILSDCYRYIGGGIPTLRQILTCYYLNVGFRFTFWMRLARCSISFLSLFSRFTCRHLNNKYHIDISWRTQIGYGFRIFHGGPCVINESAVIGNNVDIFQYVTIGSSFFHAAHIGNNVYIGPSVCVVENVNIGVGVTVGAGAVVVKDVPKGATVAGVPAKIVSYKKPGRLVWSRWQHNFLHSD